MLASLTFAFSHLHTRSGDRALLAFKNHPDDEVRTGVAFSLSGTELPEGIDALLELARDPYERARDWAVTALADYAPLDDPRIHEALWQASFDESHFVRAEAMGGLARRGDRRVVVRLIDELSVDDDYHTNPFDDAACLLLGLDEFQSSPPKDKLVEGLRGLIVH